MRSKLLRVSQFVPNPQPFLATTKGDSPLETPNLWFSFYFLFLLLVVISFGYLAIYTNEHLLLNNVDRAFSLLWDKRLVQGNPTHFFNGLIAFSLHKSFHSFNNFFHGFWVYKSCSSHLHSGSSSHNKLHSVFPSGNST